MVLQRQMLNELWTFNPPIVFTGRRLIAIATLDYKLKSLVGRALCITFAIFFLLMLLLFSFSLAT